MLIPVSMQTTYKQYHQNENSPLFEKSYGVQLKMGDLFMR